MVSVTIPTRDSASSLPLCLGALAHQSYKQLEISVVDAGSTDATIQIAKKFGVQNIFTYKGALLGARALGIRKAKGKYVLLLDSDQILSRDSIERAVTRCETRGFDMLALSEDVYEAKTWLQTLFAMDRTVINASGNLDPETGVILPRFFRATILKKALTRIPKSLLSTVGGPDHAILYFESYAISQKVGVLSGSVRHIEPSAFIPFIKKFYRWGYTGMSAKSLGRYQRLMQKKERFRTGLFRRGLFVASLGSVALLLLKGIPYKIGYVIAKMTRPRYE